MTVPGQFDEKDHAALNDELINIKKVWWVFPDWSMVVGLVVSVCASLYFVSFAGRLVGVLASVYCATQVAYRLGVYYGFTRGFREGHEKGVQRANEPVASPPP